MHIDADPDTGNAVWGLDGRESGLRVGVTRGARVCNWTGDFEHIGLFGLVYSAGTMGGVVIVDPELKRRRLFVGDSITGEIGRGIPWDIFGAIDGARGFLGCGGFGGF